MKMAGWKYNQMRNFKKKIEHQIRPQNTLTTFEKMCMKISEPNHLLSQMYKLMLSEQETTIPYFIKEWEN